MANYSPNYNLYLPSRNDADVEVDTSLTTNFTNIDNGLANHDAQLANISSDDTFKNNHFVSSMDSYIGVVNTGYTTDNGTRFYVVPKAKVTTGAGGVIKVFGDDYQNGADYRDFGIYFYADQNGDKGYHGTGVFWLNSKVFDGTGATMLDENPDIGFSFQDGAVVAGRWVYFANGTKRAILHVGGSLPSFAPSQVNIGLELEKWLALHPSQGIYFYAADNTSANSISGDDRKLKHSLLDGTEFYISGNMKFNLTTNTSEFSNAIIKNAKLSVSTAITTLDMTGYNRAKINVSTAHTITSITGVTGQQITILFVNTNTTIQNNSTIFLQGGINFVSSANTTLTLENFDGVWYEVSRSVNHA